MMKQKYIVASSKEENVKKEGDGHKQTVKRDRPLNRPCPSASKATTSTEATRDSQQYFIPPISTILFISFVLLVASYFGFRQLNPIVLKTFLAKKVMEKRKMVDTLETINVKYYEEVKQTARIIAFLYIIMTINWIFEIISFYVHSLDSSPVLFDILNALQGIVIFIIFVCLPKPMAVIKHWWHDRGSLVLQVTEMQVLNNGGT